MGGESNINLSNKNNKTLKLFLELLQSYKFDIDKLWTHQIEVLPRQFYMLQPAHPYIFSIRLESIRP